MKSGKMCVVGIIFAVLFLYSMNLVNAQVVTHNNKRYEKINGEWYFTKDGMTEKQFLHQIIVKYQGRDKLTLQAAKIIGGSNILKIINHMNSRLYALIINEELAGEECFSILDNLRNSGLFTAVDFNGLGRLASEPNDTYWDDEQEDYLGASKVDMPSAWDRTAGNSSIKLAILDSGVDLDHPELINNLITGYDYFSDDSSPQDEYGHGTQMAGIIAARANNDTAIAGIAGGWGNIKGVSIMPLRVAGPTGGINSYGLASALEHARNNGVDVINMSIFLVNDYEYVESEIEDAVTAGIFLVAAVGNTNGGSVQYPAKYNNVIGVSAVNKYDVIWNGSSKGTEVDICAPGGDGEIHTIGINAEHVTTGQTSAAAAHVSGLAALLLSKVPSTMTATEVWEKIRGSADDVGTAGYDTLTGYGRINARKALENLHLHVPSDYSSVEAGLTAASSGDTVTVHTGTYTETGNLTVNSGVLMIVQSGTTIKMADNTKIYVYGKMDATSTIFTSSNASPSNGDWDGIYLYTNATNASEIDQCTIKYANYGIYMHNNKAHIITGTTIENCGYGIYGDAGGQQTITGASIDLCNLAGIKLVSNTCPQISGSTVENTLYSGVYLDGSSPRFWQSSIFGNGQNGIYMTNQSVANLASASTRVDNRIYDNDNHEFLIDNSFPILGTSLYGTDDAQQEVTDNAGYLLYLTDGSEVLAEMVWWGTAWPPSSLFFLQGGTSLDYNPWATSGLDKGAGGEPASLSAFESGRSLLIEGRYQEGIAELKKEIQDHPESREAYRSLVELFALNGQGSYEESSGNFLEYLALLSESDNALRVPALNFAAVELANGGFYADASAVHDYLLTDESNRTPSLLSQAFNYYLFDVVDIKRAGELQDLLRRSGATEYIILMAEQDLQNISENPPPFDGEMKSSGLFRVAGISAPRAAENASIPETFELRAAYPNPFNPITTIRFDIPEAGNVRIVIYNVLGQQVAELVNGDLPAGSHQRVWDASRLGSGIYLVRMEAKDFTKTMKVTLLK